MQKKYIISLIILFVVILIIKYCNWGYITIQDNPSKNLNDTLCVLIEDGFDNDFLSIGINNKIIFAKNVTTEKSTGVAYDFVPITINKIVKEHIMRVKCGLFQLKNDMNLKYKYLIITKHFWGLQL